MKPKDFLRNKKNKSIVNLNDLKFDSPVLFHGSEHEHAASNLQLGHIKARTVQRYWEDGHTYKDDHEKYESSGWMFGWSMTRERNMAGSWKNVVFVFDRDKVKSQYKVKPLSWSYRVSQGSRYYKQEREDYVIGGKDPRSTEDLRHEYENYMDNNLNNEYEDYFDYQNATRPEKKLDINEKNLKGFLVSDFIIDLYGKDDPDIQYLLNHKLYLGTYNRDNSELNLDKQKNPSKTNNPFNKRC